MTIEWTEKLSVGNETIDNDHKQLIKLINAYEQVIAQQKYEMLGPAFKSLEQYANEHFLREEQLMDAIHYPDRRLHRDKHSALLKSVRQKHREVKENADIDLDALSKFLRDWLINHVIKEDMQLKPYLMGGRDENLTPVM